MSLKKTASKEAPHAIFHDYRSGFTWRVLKTYQTFTNEKKNPYARWFCAVTSPMTMGTTDMGDCYVRDILSTKPKLVSCTEEFAESYGIPQPSVEHVELRA